MLAPDLMLTFRRLSPFGLSALLGALTFAACSSEPGVDGPSGSGGQASDGDASGGDASGGAQGTGTGGSGGGNMAGSSAVGGGFPAVEALPITPALVVDQFGYRPDSEKIAVLRRPSVGFDADASFEFASSYSVVDAADGHEVLTLTPTAWNAGAVDESSGDAADWLDFSQLTAAGEYYIVDTEHSVRSARFSIADDVYRDVLVQALRTFYYQRAGFAKDAEFAGPGWADGASHLGALQDGQCRHYDAGDASTERDLSGGWYDAGDYNKYTAWHARYVVSLLTSYQESPQAFGDDTGIPESGNGTPDLLDEVRFGLDWLEKMQDEDGSLLSIVGLDHASPPSAATGPSAYGDASTFATASGAAAFALGATLFRSEDEAYAEALLERAEQAFSWTAENPEVEFRNNDSAAGTAGLGAGQQETDTYGRMARRMVAAVLLFEASEDAAYRTFIDENYQAVHLLEWGYLGPWELDVQDALLKYAAHGAATASVATDIEATYLTAAASDDNLGAHEPVSDPYLAHLPDYTWGSNGIKAIQGTNLYAILQYGLDETTAPSAVRAAERYVHYLHGVNPLGLVYLSNMAGFGAERSVSEFYHSWFVDGSPDWDKVGQSTYGPAPGFLAGGPNPSYEWDACCVSASCGSAENNALCGSAPPSPPAEQPPQKSYLEFNDNWPLNSWAITENSNGYQVEYIRLLSKFVD